MPSVGVLGIKKPHPFGWGLVCPPLDRQRGLYFLLDKSFGGELSKTLGGVLSLDQVPQHRLADSVGVLEAITLNLMGQVLRGGVVQVVQVVTALLKPILIKVSLVFPDSLLTAPHCPSRSYA